MEQMKNTMHVMKDNIGTTWHADPAWCWVCSNRERRKNNIINGLMEVIKELMSIEDLNPHTISYNPKQSSTNNIVPVELQHNDRTENKTKIASIEEEQITSEYRQMRLQHERQNNVITAMVIKPLDDPTRWSAAKHY